MKLNSLLLLLTSAAALQAGTVVPPPMVNTAPSDGWHFRFAPYAWVTGVDGDVRVGNLTSPVDISISDTLDTLDMAFMGLFEASHGRWAIGVDAVYGKTSESFDAGGRIFERFRFEQTQWIISPTVAYRIIDTPNYRMELTAGGRITLLEAELTGGFVGGGHETASRDADLIDPIVGLRGQANITNQFFFRYSGSIGGFGTSSDLIWDAFAGVGYNITDSVSVAVGYRGMGVDFEKDRFAMNTISHGPVLGLEVRW